MVVAEIETLKQQAQRRLELTFATPVAAAEFEVLDTVQSVTVADEGHTIVVIVAGSVDPVIKEAARYEVVNIVSHDGDLESAFLAYYSEAPDVA